jgi:hypothetical protein
MLPSQLQMSQSEHCASLHICNFTNKAAPEHRKVPKCIVLPCKQFHTVALSSSNFTSSILLCLTYDCDYLKDNVVLLISAGEEYVGAKKESGVRG